ncbi:MAG: TIGR02587 family membrane protein [Pyrinomonadaceae bacterium]|nr:TIGR02587 family membrane protein [Pyrinomonadaceae bacterium]
MPSESKKDKPERSDTRRFFVDLARAFGGAILFSFPMLMTMELWFLGFYMNGLRLTIFTLLTIPLLIGLSYFDGFEATSSVWDDTIDTFVAYAVGFISATAMLFLFGVIEFGMSTDEIIGKISVQAIVGGFGAMFARSLLTGDQKEEEESEKRQRDASYFGELFLMAVGAVFLSMSVAPTEEMTLISYKMTDWHTLALAVATILMMHAFVYSVEYRDFEQELPHHHTSFVDSFLRFTVVGYAIVLLISFYILWTFGSIDEMAFAEKLKATIVLGFPAAIGASASRLIL